MRLPLEPTSTDRRWATAGSTTPTSANRWARVVALLLAAVVVSSSFAAGASAQADPTVAPVTTISPDGRTGTDGTRTLAISRTADLDPAGATVSVSGSGYDDEKGIYVALCAIPPRNYVPTPCGGGVDTEGTQGAAQWISSNPPAYGVGLAQPYGPNGSFQTSFHVKAEISAGIDCRQVRCAIVTRNDHTRSSDRSQDIIIPVTFRSAPVATPPPTVPDPGVTPTVPGPAPSTTAPVVTVPPLANPTTTAPAPTATVAPDGRSTSDGTRTLAATAAADLDPERQAITVTGQGFDETRGVYVGLCAVPAPGEAPGPCLAGSPEVNRWVSSNPPEYGVGIATPYGAGGTFEVELSVAAVIDGATDCRTVACAIVTRADDTATDDRTLDLVLPVSFAAASAGTSLPPTTAPPADAEPDEAEDAASVVIDESSSSVGPLVAVGAAAVVLALVGGGVARNAQRRTAAVAGTTGGASATTGEPHVIDADGPTGDAGAAGPEPTS